MEVVKDGVQIAKVTTPGAVFGELFILLDQCHTADVRALEHSEFHIADAPTFLASDSTVALYVAAILAQRLDSANRARPRSNASFKRATRAAPSAGRSRRWSSYCRPGVVSVSPTRATPTTRSYPVNPVKPASLVRPLLDE